MASNLQVSLVRTGNQKMSNNAYINPIKLNLYRAIRQGQRTGCFAARSKHGFALINDHLVVRLHADRCIGENEIALNEMHCEYAKTWRGCVATVERFELPNDIEMEALYIELQMPSWPLSEIDARGLEKCLKKGFSGQIMHVGQRVQFKYYGSSGTYTVNRVILGGNRDEAVSNSGMRGMLTGKTNILFDPLTKNLKIANQITVPGRLFRRDINPKEAEHELKVLGVGGMGRKFYELYLKVLATRSLDPKLLERLELTHGKGILLYGPPGTGKTLFMRAISKILYAREPKLVSGPEVMSKWVGESEENIREVFHDAYADYERYGENSPLHIIIFDEIDSITQRRGKVHNESGSDRVVSQLLTTIDGAKKLNNVLIVGTTNRKDLIDDALLRPGRLGIHIEVGLPDGEEDRLKILEVHTEKMKQCLMLQSDVDLQQIASMTIGWSGAELESIAKHALSNALSRINHDGSGYADESQVRVNHTDFVYGVQVVRPSSQSKSTLHRVQHVGAASR